MRQTCKLILISALAIFLLLFSLTQWRYARRLQRAYKQGTTAIPCQLSLNGSTGTEAQGTFQHLQLYQLAHGITLYLQTPPELAKQTATHLEAWKTLGGPWGRFTLTQQGNQMATGNLTVVFGRDSILAGDNLLMPVARLNPSLPPGEYLLTVTLAEMPAEWSAADITLLGRYELCSLARMREQFALILAIVAIVLFIFALWPVCTCSLAVWRCYHRPVASGNGILYVLTSYPLWSETFLRLDLHFLQQHNHFLHAIALYTGDTAVQPGWPEVQVLSRHSGRPQKRRSMIAARLVNYFARLLPKWLRAQLSLHSHHHLRQKLVDVCRERSIGHIHAEFADLAALLAADVARELGCTFSIGIHAVDIHASKYPLRQLFGEAVFIAVCNEAAAQAFRQKCPWAASRLHLIHHGLDLKQWPYEEQNGLDAGTEAGAEAELNLLFIGRLVPKKGVAILLEALSLLRQSGMVNTRLTIIGDGPLRPTLEQQAKQLQVNKLITWAGVLKQEEVRKHLRQASCLCVPSIVDASGDRDGIPNVVTEAMASGVPIVGSQEGSLPEVLTEETGWPIAEMNAENLADSIRKMIAQPEERKRRKQNARRRIEFDFNAEKLAEVRSKLLEKAIGE